MRTILITLCILVALALAVAGFLFATTPSDAPPLRFPLTAAQTELLAHVPADAEAYGLIPAPAVLLDELAANPVTRDAVEQWTREHPLPPAAMLGRAEAVVWKRGSTTSYAVRFDPIRAVIVRLWTAFSNVEGAWHGATLLINASTDSQAVPDPRSMVPPAELADAGGLPEGNVFVVQRTGARGAFPPIGRPALTSARVDAGTIEITSRARLGGYAVRAPVRHSLPANAMLSIAFTEPPRLLGDFRRLLDVEGLVGEGATIALYGVDTGTLLPRPFAAIVIPANDRNRATLAKYGGIVQTAQKGAELVVSFDRNSGAAYLADRDSPVWWPANRWSVRIDPAKLVPVLRKVGDNPALRFATPRVHRGARDLRRWIGALEHARSIEATSSAAAGTEELRVRVASK
jgi:hypothetical protein